MSLRETFGVNLTRLAKARGSLNLVARQIGIERRQFRKYTAGERIPNKATLARIARYFDIAEDALFSGSDARQPNRHWNRAGKARCPASAPTRRTSIPVSITPGSGPTNTPPPPSGP